MKRKLVSFHFHLRASAKLLSEKPNFRLRHIAEVGVKAHHAIDHDHADSLTSFVFMGNNVADALATKARSTESSI